MNMVFTGRDVELTLIDLGRTTTIGKLYVDEAGFLRCQDVTLEALHQDDGA